MLEIMNARKIQEKKHQDNWKIHNLNLNKKIKQNFWTVVPVSQLTKAHLQAEKKKCWKSKTTKTSFLFSSILDNIFILNLFIIY